MHNNRIWLALLGGIAVACCVFSFRAGMELWRYYGISEKAWVADIDWQVVQEDRYYYPYATYAFEVDGTRYSGAQNLDREWQRNQWAAEKKIEELAQYRWSVWYSVDHPEQSTLDRTFPWRSVVYAVVMIGLLIYFVGLGFYVGGLHN